MAPACLSSIVNAICDGVGSYPVFFRDVKIVCVYVRAYSGRQSCGLRRQVSYDYIVLLVKTNCVSAFCWKAIRVKSIVMPSDPVQCSVLQPQMSASALEEGSQ
jgi:hypothetical protein